jgi:uncharacterized cupin superfamily protein
MSRPPCIVNANDLEWKRATARGERFASERKAFTGPAGGQKLGCSLMRVPPGKTAFPHHRHHGNEEAIYILSGTGTLRLDDAEHAVGPGDYIALTAGGPAHQLIATGNAPLEYLCFSTMLAPEVVEYPDAGKVGAIAGVAPGGDVSQRTVFRFYKTDANVDYWEGE